MQLISHFIWMLHLWLKINLPINGCPLCVPITSIKTQNSAYSMVLTYLIRITAVYISNCITTKSCHVFQGVDFRLWILLSLVSRPNQSFNTVSTIKTIKLVAFFYVKLENISPICQWQALLLEEIRLGWGETHDSMPRQNICRNDTNLKFLLMFIFIFIITIGEFINFNFMLRNLI